MVGIRSLSLALLTLALLPASASADATTQIIVKREPGLTAAERADLRGDADVRFVENLRLARTEVVAAQAGDVSDALRDLNADPDVVYAERNRKIRGFGAGADQCGPYGTNACLWGVAKIFAPDPTASWGVTMGGGRTVAVVDSGVDAQHPDLAGQVAAGHDWVEDDDEAQDQNGHGTHVAGTIAAVRENGKGIVGVAPEARVVPLRVLDGTGTGSTSDGVAAFDWAGDNGIRVVNASLGGLGFRRSEYEAIKSHPDTLFVVAAGNEGQDNDQPTTAQYPCAYGIDHPEQNAPALENILCVGASTRSDARAGFSNFGAASVPLWAPGVGIISTALGALALSDGTSMATPHVAATAALLAARGPWLGVDELKQRILDSADAVAAGRRLNAREALELVPDDADGDGVIDADNCPDEYNPDQEDADSDDIGDACEAGAPGVDREGDGVIDSADACPDERWVGDGCPAPAVTAPDADHDGVSDDVDLCPQDTVTGGFGCPDDDSDRVPNDGRDNCPFVANPSQADTDADGPGDACDGTPRGHDNDRDGKPALDDACPDVYGTLANGCPAPSPPADRDGDGRIDAGDACPTEYAISKDGCPLAQVIGLSAGARKRSANVTVTTSRPATVKILVQRKKGRTWVRVMSKTIATSGNRARLKTPRLRLGLHRVKVTISSSGGAGTPRTKSFRVR